MVISDDHIQEVMTALDIDKNGVVDFAEFTRWYVKSEERIKNEDRRIFNEFDIQQNGTITLRQLEQCLIAMQVENVSDMVQSGYKVFGSDEKGGDNHEVEGDRNRM
jgi:Ca2+-binding EF-hand superfamily protein